MRKTWVIVLLFAAFLLSATGAFAADVSLSSLLDEMVDRNAITRFPDPFYTCKQASSYDRASKSPTENWFANADTSQFVREETNDGRKEWVLIDEKGPGAIVRWWITAPHYKVNFRIYLDGKAQPDIVAKIDELVGGEYLVGAPLSSPRANGRNLYLPIPYAKSIKITVDDMPTQSNLYYQLNFRTYAEGTQVETFSLENLKSLQEKIAKVQKNLLRSPIAWDESSSDSVYLDKNGGEEVMRLDVDSPVTINSFAIRIEAKDITQAMRSTLMRMSFDGVETVRCPLGDFFGGGVGINPFKTWYTRVDKNGTMYCFWKMPFKSSVEAKYINYDPNQSVRITLEKLSVSPIEWTDNTMYFFANWRQDRDIPTIGGDGQKQDWNYISLQGKGVFVGDSLSLLNRDPGWWGEGDEKIYVDGETFPSHFGTGTEDYYGYAWGTPAFFEAPSHAQPRAEGPNSYGNVTNDRFRILDGIPFTRDFRFDMEIWHWATTTVDYSVVTYWYGFPGIKPVDAPTGKFPSDAQVIEEVKAKVLYGTPFTLKIPGFDIKDKPTGGQLSRQVMSGWPDGKWKDDDQLWWTETKPGDKLELNVVLEKSGPQKLVCEMTKARDYGQFQFYLDGKKVGGVVDLYNKDNVIHTGPIEIGTVDAEKGPHVLTVEVLGKNPDSVGTMFGLDVYRFE